MQAMLSTDRANMLNQYLMNYCVTFVLLHALLWCIKSWGAPRWCRALSRLSAQAHASNAARCASRCTLLLPAAACPPGDQMADTPPAR